MCGVLRASLSTMDTKLHRSSLIIQWLHHESCSMTPVNARMFDRCVMLTIELPILTHLAMHLVLQQLRLSSTL